MNVAVLASRVGRDNDAEARRTRRRVIVLLGAVLALNTADIATVGAVAGELERDLHLSHVDIGLMVALSALIGAVATVPAGVLTDRRPRMPMLWVSVVLWCVAMLVSAVAWSYPVLLLSRVALGVVAAAAGPVLISLTGDLFEPGERARVYGSILSGEIVGAGIGYVVCGSLAGATTWRASFVLLAVPGLVLAWVLRRELPEPARGGADRLPPAAGREAAAEHDDLLQEEVEREGVAPDEALVLRGDPARIGLRGAVRHVLSIPTNRVLIVASALGYFFFTGVQTFAVVLLRDRFDVSQTAASLLVAVMGVGAVTGVLAGGRFADRQVARGHAAARVSVPAGTYVAAAVVLAPAMLSSSLVVALPLFAVAAGFVGASNPPLDAARLDVVPGALWGRAESVRTVLRQTGTAAAPLAFAAVAQSLAGGHGSAFAGAEGAQGDLADTFLIMSSALVLAGLILARGRGRFARDVATAAAGPQG